MGYKRKIKSFEKKEFKESFSNKIKREVIENILKDIKKLEKLDFELILFGFYLINKNVYKNILNESKTKIDKFLNRVINNIYEIEKKNSIEKYSTSNREYEKYIELKVNEIINSLKEIDKKQYKYILIGMFLSGGYIADPKRAYNLEFNFSLNKLEKEYKEITENIVKYILDSLDIKYNIYEDKEIYKVYIRKGDEIVKVLALIGSGHGVLRFEEERVIKSVNQELNRNLNFETSNMQKMLLAANKQKDAINKIRKNNIELDKKLELAAELRLRYPEVSLKELSEKGNISRSTLNQRLKKIEKIAEEIKN